MAPRGRDPLLLSIVVAVYNEEACLRELTTRIDRALTRGRFHAELVIVDDGSTDRSFTVIEELAAGDQRVRGIRLARNEGHQSALMCGIACARGDVIVTLDADLQHPPEFIPDMLEAWRSGFDVVHMRRREGGERWLRASLARAFYALFNAVSDVGVAPRSTDFRLVDRTCIPSLADAWGRRGFLRAAARALDVRQTELTFDAPARFAGAGAYTLPKLLILAVHALFPATRRSPANRPQIIA